MESLEYLISMRRALHQIPELSEQEFKTADFLFAELKKLGYKPKRMKTGVVCDVDGLTHSRKIALRADTDALPILEKSDCGFASQNGCMHACGHDGHMAMLLEAARLMRQSAPKCDVRLIFQFGEEGSGGAEQMIALGVLDRIDEIYAFHLCPELTLGQAASTEGPMFAGAVEFDAEFTGKASHCANKEKGRDALSAAVKFLAESDSFNAACKSNTLFHTGKLTSGSARNIVADQAKAECTLRFFDENEQEAVMMNAAKSLTKTDSLFLTEHRVTVHAVYPPLINGGLAYKTVKSAFPALKDCAPRFTAEDFAFYTQKISGCMTWLGCKDETHFSPLHSDTFNFDERALLTGIEIYKNLVF